MNVMSVYGIYNLITEMVTQSHCKSVVATILYAQQHPTRLGKQLHPQTVGLLVSSALKNITIRASHL